MKKKQGMLDAPCPCGTGKCYSECCHPLHNNTATAKTPLELMRSRYTAFFFADIDYIARTQKAAGSEPFNSHETKKWLKHTQFFRLDIINAPPVPMGASHGFVDFTTHYIEKRKKKIISENSRFEWIDDQWFYMMNNTPQRGER